MNFEKKIIDEDQLKLIIKNNKSSNKKIGLCHGVFDIVHFGHFTHFKECKKNCDILVVSVTTDKFVNKGPGRPEFNIYQRLQYLSSLHLIDYVIESQKKSAEYMLNFLKPDYYFKGPDYKNLKHDKTRKIYNEIKILKKNGGKYYVTSKSKYSSSHILNKINYNNETNSNSFKKIINKFNYSDIEKHIESFKKLKILIIGEVIIDHYIFCKALGKSGKEPVLAMEETGEKKFLGGIGGIANNLAEFSNDVTILSTINKDSNDYNFIKRKLNKKIKNNFLFDNNVTNRLKKN